MNTTQEQANLQDMVTRWYDIKSQITALQGKEQELRRAIAAVGFPDAPEKGTSRHSLGYGKELKLTSKLNYTVDRHKLEMTGNNVIPDAVRSAVFRMKPEVVEAALVAVTDPDVMHALSEIITSKPALPLLEVVDAKKRG